ncbi:MAG: serine/threonine-protein kinase [Verrucomicrobia bacterium]|nr:serine/threonine-protein kinase [Verrucomicrobiota bacterium]
MNASDLPDETLFEGALKCRTLEERSAYLDRHCTGQPALRRNLEALIAAHEASGEFLEPTVPAGRPTIKLDLAPEETPGTMIGRYKLLQKIGEGGMGVVYMAEQTEPVVRKVALKIIKLGMDTKAVVARFEAERQALALMDHPNIAKVLDAGATETPLPVGRGEGQGEGSAALDPRPSTLVTSAGRPYFVMELVHGVPITEYCDKNQLTTQQRLELFIPVCQAIQHAHQKGIIHRDIKPSNVMVTLHDGVPVPKVIDFGVAKATNQRLTEKTLFTNYAQMIGTPAYMSPEQAEMSGLDIDTRSDIYSLGVLLYELLTGTTPFDAKELLSKGYAEMQRIIVEQEPVKPSTRMSTLTDEQRTVVTTHRNTDASALRKVLQGDLDWIVMKCLEKDRTRRYETSNGLAADLRRHLNNELITARPPTTGYLLKKLIKRNKLAFAAASAVAGALVIGVLVATWQAVRATRAERLATERLQESEAITKFITGVFQSPDPERDGRTITVAETLDKAVTNLETELASQPLRRARLQAVLGATYHALGLYTNAITLEEKVRDYYLATFGLEAPDTLDAMYCLSAAYEFANRNQEGIAMMEQVLPLRRKVLGPEHPDTLLSMGNLASAYGDSGRWPEALKLEEEVLRLRRKVLGPEHPNTLMAMHNLAISYSDAGKLDQGLKLLEETLRLSGKVNGPEHPHTLAVMTDLAADLGQAGRVKEAIKLQEQSLAIKRRVLPPNHRWLAAALGNLARLYELAGRAPEAVPLREEFLALTRSARGSEHPETLVGIGDLANACYAAGRRAEALTLRQEWLSLSRKAYGENDPNTCNAMIGVAASLRATNRFEEALQFNQSALGAFRRAFGDTNTFTLNAMTELAITYRMAGKLPEAIPLETDALRLKRQHLAPSDPMLLESLDNLATCYELSNRQPDAEPLRRELAELKAKVESQKPAPNQSPTAPTKP